MFSEESTGTSAGLDLVPTLTRSFPLEHFCYFKLFSAAREEKGKKEENRFPLANDSLKHISAAVRGEESGIITPTWEETHELAGGKGMHQTQLCWLLLLPLSSPVVWKAQHLVCSALDF